MGVVILSAGLCRHCRRNKAGQKRGLCHGCYGDGAVRALYPPRPKRSPGQRNERPSCWGCGGASPLRPGRQWTTRLAALGWRVRRITLAGISSVESELYCPACFAAHGWPELRDGWAEV